MHRTIRKFLDIFEPLDNPVIPLFLEIILPYRGEYFDCHRIGKDRCPVRFIPRDHPAVPFLHLVYLIPDRQDHPP